MDLNGLLTLEEHDVDSYSAPTRPGPVYGGQLIAQSLRAAAHTVDDDRSPHSLHAYFLRPGRGDEPLTLRVSRHHDGGSFSHRHVIVEQRAKAIFSMTASFQRVADGYEWSSPAGDPEMQPEELEDRAFFPMWDGILRLRSLPSTKPHRDDEIPAPARLWVRSAAPLPADPIVQSCAVAYISDLGSGFGDGTALPGPRNGPTLDHALWFHHPVRADEWLNVDLEPIKAVAVRGLYTGSIRNRNGDLAAVLTQELLLTH